MPEIHTNNLQDPSAALRHPYPSVKRGEALSYGGSQRWSWSRTMQKYGCGVIACTDLLLYLHRYRPGCRTGALLPAADGPLPLNTYNDLADRLRRRYFPLIPGAGLNCLVLASGLNRYFHANRIPLRAAWGAPQRRLWRGMEEMLAADLPVILCIGHNFPLLWRKNKLSLYTRVREEEYRFALGVKAHYVTVTGMDGAWLRISSWGREYFISRAEYSRYVAEHSNALMSNIVLLRPRRREM